MIEIKLCNEIPIGSPEDCKLPPYIPCDYIGTKFVVGDYVVFCLKNKKLNYGKITKINRKNVSIKSRNGSVIRRQHDNVVVILRNK